MSTAAVLRELKRLGTPQNAKIYRRHGAREDVYGVSFGNLRPLARRLGPDQAVALGLWESGNADARCLAALVADPEALAREDADRWVADISCYLHADLVGELVARTPFALEALDDWTRSREELRASDGLRRARLRPPLRRAAPVGRGVPPRAEAARA